MLAPAQALAVCGDGVKQANEACDTTAAGGEAACPNRCIAPPAISACSCATVSNDFRDYAVISNILTKLGKDASIVGGSVAVQEAEGALFMASGASIPSSETAIADRCRLQDGSSVGTLFCNEDIIQEPDSVQNGGPFPFLQAAVQFPNLPTFAARQPSS